MVVLCFFFDFLVFGVFFSFCGYGVRGWGEEGVFFEGSSVVCCVRGLLDGYLWEGEFGWWVCGIKFKVVGLDFRRWVWVELLVY